MTDQDHEFEQSVSATQSDWSRVYLRRGWNGSRQLLKCLRRYDGIDANGRAGRKPGSLLRKWIILQHRFWSVVCGCEIHPGTQIGGGLILPHPIGIVIHPGVTIGPNCMILQNVTLGTNRSAGVPRIGGHVDIGPGAVVIGNVTVGDHAVIGANAVVLSDVPAGTIVGGIPARNLRDTRQGKTP